MHAYRPARSRYGFTLIELLVVIAVLGMLASFAGFAAFRAMHTAKERAIISEIGLLSGALDAYKEAHQMYPPCMAQMNFNGANSGTKTAPTGSGYLTRDQMLTTHMHIGYDNYAYSSASLRALTYAYKYITLTGSPAILDMDTMDPAESLVFWLGGFPCPYSTTTSSYVCGKKLVGLRKEYQNPFQWCAGVLETTYTGDKFLNLRTQPFFDFDEARLADADGDGWWEYYPEKFDVTNSVTTWPAPYVYFDATTYSNWRITTTGAGQMLPPFSAYPGTPGILPQFRAFPGPDLIMSQGMGGTGWGTAVPYMRTVSGSVGKIDWVNPDSFQIICAGLDHQYSQVPYVATDPYYSIRGTVYQGIDDFTNLPSGLVNANFPTVEERDNLSNFANSNFGDDLGF
ncbi:MAG TPA: type II secretion system protein [Pirellulales bacterium]|jgi:prepilin-type N-terminal cleavage/methylation domain-containing protein|nr:type II secretion system protein [Pirellulales bacterium]